MNLPMKRTVFDLNSACLFGHAGSAPQEGATHAGRQNGLRAVDGFHSSTRVSPLCESLWRQLQSQHLHLLGPISLPLCPTDRAREFARDQICLRALGPRLYHSGVRGHVSRSTLADANELRDYRIYADLGQARIATARSLYADESFGRSRSRPSTPSTPPPSISAWRFFLGALSRPKCCRHAYPARPAGQHSCLHCCQTRENPRDSHPRRASLEPGGIYLMDRYLDFARLYALDQARAFFVTRPARTSLFIASAHFPSQDHWPPLRSEHSPEKLLSGQVLSPTLAAHSLPRPRNRTDLSFSPIICFCPRSSSPSFTSVAGKSNCSSSGSNNICASRNSTASTQRGENSDLDRHLCLCPASHRPQALEAPTQLVLQVPQIQPLAVRKNATFTGFFANKPIRRTENPCNQLNLFDL